MRAILHRKQKEHQAMYRIQANKEIGLDPVRTAQIIHSNDGFINVLLVKASGGEYVRSFGGFHTKLADAIAEAASQAEYVDILDATS